MVGAWLLLATCALSFSFTEASIISLSQEPPVWPDEYAGDGIITHGGQTIMRFRVLHSKSKEADRYDLIGDKIGTSIINVQSEEVGIAMTDGSCYFIEEFENPYGVHFLLPDLTNFKLHKNTGVYLDGTLVQDWRDGEGNYGAYVERRGIYGIPKAIWGPKSTANFTHFNQYKSRCTDFDFTAYKDRCQGPPENHKFKCVD